MKTLLIILFTLLVGFAAKAQRSAQIANLFNFDSGINPPNIVYVDDVASGGYWHQTSLSNLRLGQNQINGLMDSVANLRTAIGFKYPKTNPSSYISGISQAMVIAALGFTPYSNANPNNFISSVPAQTFSSITGKPTTLSGYGIIDAYPLTGNPSGFISSVPSKVFSTPTFVSSTTATQLSVSRDSNVSYAYDASVAITVLGGQGITAVLTYADNSAMTTNPVIVDSNGISTLGLAGLSQTQTVTVKGWIPSGKYRRVTFTLTQTGTAALPSTPTIIKSGQEVLF